MPRIMQCNILLRVRLLTWISATKNGTASHIVEDINKIVEGSYAYFSRRKDRGLGGKDGGQLKRFVNV